MNIDNMSKDKHGNARFYSFREGKIDNFAPTYKVNKKGKYYDKYSLKKRNPGWTDRIIWRTKKYVKDGEQPKNTLVQVNYDSNNDFHHSDHRPVFAQFILNDLELSEDIFDDDDFAFGGDDKKDKNKLSLKMSTGKAQPKPTSPKTNIGAGLKVMEEAKKAEGAKKAGEAKQAPVSPSAKKTKEIEQMAVEAKKKQEEEKKAADAKDEKKTEVNAQPPKQDMKSKLKKPSKIEKAPNMPQK